DIVFQNTATGQIVIWFLNGSAFVGGGALSLVPSTGYKVVGTGDLNSDGHRDLVFEDTATGKIAVWYMNGLNVLGSAPLTNLPTSPDPNNQVVGVSDVNWDGTPDLIFQNLSTRVISFWTLQGTRVIGSSTFAYVPASGYSVVGVGDFNADGKTDLLFQNSTTGQLVYWLLDGTSLMGAAAVSAYVSSGWHVAGIRSFDSSIIRVQ
ncbi:MAG: multicopper oxidase, type 2, partial [Chthonomonadales bacterium]|nr:multicopper oxidase, type 2 [Chthonomonadales bacterium]